MKRRFSSLVGKIKFNESVSPVVLKEFTQYPSTFDRIEIFDNSIPNDPSPPSKAAAVILRSKLNISMDSALACVTVLRQKIFDYNNRDFQKCQLQNLVDSISSNWLRDQGGGIQLTIHRIPTEARNKISIFRKMNTLNSAEAAARSLEFGVHRSFKSYHGISFFLNPLDLSGHITPNSSSFGEPAATVEGLRDELASYVYEDAVLSVIFIEKFRRTLYCTVYGLAGDIVVSRERFKPAILHILRVHKCFEGVLLSEKIDPKEAITESLIITRACVDQGFPEELRLSSLKIHPEFVA